MKNYSSSVQKIQRRSAESAGDISHRFRRSRRKINSHEGKWLLKIALSSFQKIQRRSAESAGDISCMFAHKKLLIR